MSFLTAFISQCFVYLIAYTPRSIKVWMAKGLAWLWFDGLRLRRFTVLKNIQRVFPDKSKEEKYRIARKSMFYTCYGFFELCDQVRLTKNNFHSSVVNHGLENYDKALAKKKGVYILSLHLGNGDMSLAFLCLNGYKVNHVSKKFKNVAINNFWNNIRNRLGARILDPHGAKLAFEIMGASRKNEAVTFVLDQFMGKPYGIESTFFGILTGTAYGLALFHIKTGAPVLPVYSYRDENLKTHLVVEPEVMVELKETDRDLQIKELTEQYNRVLEKLILKHPEQWMWIHRRWKKWE